MQFADILYRRIPYSTDFEFVCSIIDDDPQPALKNPPYMVDFDEKHIIERGGYISFNYARTDESENDIPILTFDEALEIFKKHIHKVYESEIRFLNRNLEFIHKLNNNVETSEFKAELSN